MAPADDVRESVAVHVLEVEVGPTVAHRNVEPDRKGDSELQRVLVRAAQPRGARPAGPPMPGWRRRSAPDASSRAGRRDERLLLGTAPDAPSGKGVNRKALSVRGSSSLSSSKTVGQVGLHDRAVRPRAGSRCSRRRPSPDSEREDPLAGRWCGTRWGDRTPSTRMTRLPMQGRQVGIKAGVVEEDLVAFLDLDVHLPVLHDPSR